MATTAKKTSPKKKAAKRSKAARGTKAAFVKGLPLDMPAKEVLAKAKESGISITDNHVYAVRAEMRKKGAKAAPKTTPMKTGQASSGPTGSKAGSLKDQLRQILKEIGMAEARKVIAEVEAAFEGK